MRVRAILNRDGGTLKTTDLDAFAAHLQRQFDQAGHDLDIRSIAGNELIETLKAAGDADAVDAILVGGGDGSISAAAEIAWRSGKTLGVLPAGTMNLFARSLGIPLDLNLAATALAWGQPIDCDIATANGKPFVHQFAVGMQPGIIRRRDQREHNSGFGKVMAGIAAAFSALSEPPSFAANITCDGDTLPDIGRHSLIAVSNNPFGAGHLPYADLPNTGRLGVYRTGRLPSSAYLRLAKDLVAGSFDDNPDLEVREAGRVVLDFPKLKSSAKASIDGELVPLAPTVEIDSHAGELTVLEPSADRAS